ncbi:MAG: hypothetical protein ACJA0H_000415 [Francisellaceae bacterium]|jgi:hypothetical protein
MAIKKKRFDLRSSNGVKGKSVSIRGKTFKNIKVACIHYNVKYPTVIGRMNTKLLSLEKAIFGENNKDYCSMDYFLYSFPVKRLS